MKLTYWSKRVAKNFTVPLLTTKKAFDTVWRSALWHKMLKAGIQGKLHTLIVNMYSNVISCVNINGTLSDFFVSENGVRQGENLSPFLFALFINF